MPVMMKAIHAAVIDRKATMGIGMGSLFGGSFFDAFAATPATSAIAPSTNLCLI
jgi:hypothetical protein